MNAHKCEADVWGTHRYTKCGKTAAHEHEGKWYCKTHHPPTVKAKREARNARWKAESDDKDSARATTHAALAEQKRRADCYPDLLAALIGLERAAGIAVMYADLGRIAARAAIAKAEGETP